MSTLDVHARDVMSREVVTVPASMPVEALARLLGRRGISSVPVVDDAGRLLGIVTEADLLRRVAAAEDRPLGWLRRLLGDPAEQADTYARTHGRTAAHVMTQEVVTVAPDATAAHCAHIMERHRIKRLPVVEDGRLLGVVSRADLLYAAMETPEWIGTEREDRDRHIREVLDREMRGQNWAASLSIYTDVRNGVVTFYGFYRSEEVRRALHVMAERIEGVVRVDDRLELAPPVLPGVII